MHNIQLHIIAIALATCVACLLPGTFLLLRGIALMSDAISHAVLPGIVIMFLLVGNLNSPYLVIGAALTGLATVLVTELLIQTQRLHKDTAIGLVFPFFFSIGVLLISYYARNAHLDLDMVLLGELAFAPFNRWSIGSYDMGPQALWIMAGVACCNSILIILFYKELVLATFDTTFARIVSLKPTLLYYGLMMITSITAVTALNIVGSTVVVAFMLIPAATASLLTYRVTPLLWIALLFGCTAVISGYTLAHLCDISIAGSITCIAGLLFVFTWIISPIKGMLAHFLFERSYKQALAIDVVCTYLEQGPAHTTTIAHQLGWSQNYTENILVKATEQAKVQVLESVYTLSRSHPSTSFLRR